MIQLTRSYIKDVYMIHEVKKINLSHEIIDYILEKFYKARYNINHINKFWYYLGRETNNISSYALYVDDILLTAFNKTFLRKYNTLKLFTNIKDKFDDILFLTYSGLRKFENGEIKSLDDISGNLESCEKIEDIVVLEQTVLLKNVFYNNYTVNFVDWGDKFRKINNKKAITDEFKNFIIDIYNRIIDYINYVKDIPSKTGSMTVPWATESLYCLEATQIRNKFSQIKNWLNKLLIKYERILELITNIKILEN